MKYNKSPTELLYPSNLQIDEMDLIEAFKFMLNDHSKVISAINGSMVDILIVIKKIVEHIKKKKNN